MAHRDSDKSSTPSPVVGGAASAVSPAPAQAKDSGFTRAAVSAESAPADIAALALGKAIERCARELPDGCVVVVSAENGAAWVHAEDEGEYHGIDGADLTLAEQIDAAFDDCKSRRAAIAAGAKP